MNPSYLPQYAQPYPQLAHPQFQPHGGMHMVTPPDVAMLAQQGYIQQQQQLAAMNAGAMRPPQMMGGMGMNMNMNMNMNNPMAMSQMGMMNMARGSQPQGSSQMNMMKKKKSPSSQLLPRHGQQLHAPPSTEHYVQNSLKPLSHSNGLQSEGVEPWADSLDDVDPRELAMGRYRLRHEVLGEIFGGETLKDINIQPYDPWAGLDMDQDTLEKKVIALEKGNEEMTERAESELEAFKKRIQSESGV